MRIISEFKQKTIKFDLLCKVILNIIRTVLINFPYFFLYAFYERVRFGVVSPLLHPIEDKGCVNLVLNGNSLTHPVKNELKKSFFFVCNEFCRTERFNELCPKYYVLADQQYYSKFITSSGKVVHEKTLSILNERTKWPMTLFVPVEARLSNFSDQLNNPQIKVSYYSKAPLFGAGDIARFALFQTRAIPYAANVSIPMISLAIKLGYRTLDVYGMDMSFYKNFFVNDQNKCFIKNSYFYSDDEIKPYMISSKESGGYANGNATIFFQRMYQTLAAHIQIATLTENIVNITNCSSNSVVDAYKRKIE